MGEKQNQFGELIARHLSDSRRAKNTQLPPANQRRFISRGFVALLCLLSIATLAWGQTRTSRKRPLRILTGGVWHESNTFCPILTQEKDFTLRRGNEALQEPRLAELLRAEGAEWIPTLSARASAFGVVSRGTYEKFKAEILEKARHAIPVDGVYLDLHGALHVEGYDDAQTDLTLAVRKIVGNGPLIAVGSDLHGNISREFAAALNIATCERTAPHVDEDETRLRAVALLLQALRRHQRPVVALITIPILIPGEKGITGVEPLKSVYAQLPAVSRKKGLLDASIFVGMAWQDSPRASMSAVVVADGEANRGVAEAEAKKIAKSVWDSRAQLKFDFPTDTVDGAIDTAINAPEKTVFITDSGDNITAGAAGDNTLVLQRLLAKHAARAVVAGIVDPDALLACEQAGPDKRVKLRVGGKLDTVFGKPFEFEATVRNIVPSAGAAVVDVNGVLVVLLNKRRSFTSPQNFSAVGIDPLQYKIVVVKLGYLFQALREIAPRSIMALSPGFANQWIETLPYKHVSRPIYPLDPDMRWEP